MLTVVKHLDYVVRDKKQKRAALRKLVTKLEAIGFYSQVGPTDVDRIRRQSVETGELFLGEGSSGVPAQEIPTGEVPDYLIDASPDATGRRYFIDGEDLYELGAKPYILKMKPILKRIGLALHSLDEEYGDDSHVIRINGTPFVLQHAGEMGQSLWTVTVVRMLAALNTLLDGNACQERLFFRGGGNDVEMIILTSAMHEAIRMSGCFNDSDVPQSPTLP